MEADANPRVVVPGVVLGVVGMGIDIGAGKIGTAAGIGLGGTGRMFITASGGGWRVCAFSTGLNEATKASSRWVTRFTRDVERIARSFKAIGHDRSVASGDLDCMEAIHR